MSIGNWDPSAEKATTDFRIELPQLVRFIELAENNQLNQLDQLMSSEEKQQQARLMQQDKASWFAAAQTLSDEQIVSLMRFFTVAEALPGWQAGDNSPVIWLGKVLKQRGTGIHTELLIWIKAHSNNQFLPHGALM